MTKHAIVALKQMLSVLHALIHSFGLRMMVVSVFVPAKIFSPTTMVMSMIEFASLANQIVINVPVLMDALNVETTWSTKPYFSSMEPIRLVLSLINF